MVAAPLCYKNSVRAFTLGALAAGVFHCTPAVLQFVFNVTMPDCAERHFMFAVLPVIYRNKTDFRFNVNSPPPTPFAPLLDIMQRNVSEGKVIGVVLGWLQWENALFSLTQRQVASMSSAYGRKV